MKDQPNIKLEYGDSSLEIRDFYYSKKDAEMGNPYNCSFYLWVKSGMFSGLAPCEYDVKNLRRLVDELEELYDFRRSHATLEDICYGSVVDFEMEKSGHLYLTGILYGEAMQHKLKFSFGADQTVLRPFITALKSALQ